VFLVISILFYLNRKPRPLGGALVLKNSHADLFQLNMLVSCHTSVIISTPVKRQRDKLQERSSF